MTKSNKVTRERIEALTNYVKAELQSFYIPTREIVEAEEGCIDIALFMIRFRFLPSPDPRWDEGWDLFLIPKLEDWDRDEIFWALCKKGYLCFLRNQLSKDAYQYFLQQRELWKSILNKAIDDYEYSNPFKASYCKGLLDKPLPLILSHDLTVFDWIL